MGKTIFKWLLGLFIVLQVIVSLGLLYRTEQLQAEVDSLQGQINTYRTLIFNLYGKDGG